MRVIRWEKPSRKFSRREVDNFYNGGLRSPTLFRFRTNKTELPEHGGALSLKMVLFGQEEYRIGRRSVMLQPGQFLIVDAGQHYASRIVQETESISIFFPKHERSSLLEAALSPHIDHFREGADYSSKACVPQVKFTADQRVLLLLSALIGALDGESEQNPREASQILMSEALRNLHRIAPFSNLISAKKSATRNELIRRLLKAKERIDDSAGRITDLDDLATTACLSKYYFLRLFTEVFGVTPGAYARKVRLSRAMRKIENGAAPNIAAGAAGYSDYRAFRRACVRMFRHDPAQNSQFRNTTR